MKILVVTHNYAPDRAPRAFRWAAIAEHWAGAGLHVDVVTSARTGGMLEETVNGVHVHRVGERWNGRVRRGFTAGPVAAGQSSRDGYRGASVLRNAARVVKFIYDVTWKRIYWPDHAALWYPAARAKAIELCRVHDYAAVVTVSHPFTGHIVGLALKAAFPDLRWIADVGDPFSLGGTVPFNNEAFYRHLNRRAEARVFSRCNAISVTVNGCRDAIVEIFPDTVGKIVVIPPLLSLPAPAGSSEINFDRAGRIVFVYLGVLYKRIRRPDCLLRLFAAMHARNPALQLHFFGDVQDCEDDFAAYSDLRDKAIFTHGPVSRTQVATIMSRADVLVNIGNETSFQLPSKLVEYASAGRPILTVSQTPGDTTSVFLSTYPAAHSLVCRAGDITLDQIDDVLRFAENPPPITPADLDDFLSRFRIDQIAAAYVDMIRQAPVLPREPA